MKNNNNFWQWLNSNYPEITREDRTILVIAKFLILILGIIGIIISYIGLLMLIALWIAIIYYIIFTS